MTDRPTFAELVRDGRMTTSWTTNVYTITLERISTGERAPSMVTRQTSAAAARAYADDAIRDAPEPDDLRVVEVKVRP